MASLRERQKLERSERIQENALRLFRDHGFGAVKMEEIAESSDVSAITVYRYFSTKQDLLLAIITSEFDAAYKKVNQQLARPYGNAAEAVNRLSITNLSESENAVTREMWSIAIAATISDSTSDFAVRYFRAMDRMKMQYQRLFDHAVDAEALTDDAPTYALTEICYTNLNMRFLEFLRCPGMTSATLHDTVTRLNNAAVHPYCTGNPVPGVVDA